MPWMHNFDLFLFDFDGLLVDTERLQFQAYVNTLANRGVDLGWDYSRFCQLAHLNASALREEICRKFPELEPLWKEVYQEKKAAYWELVNRGGVELMPGVEDLLNHLQKHHIARCVVTNSFRQQVELIRSKLPLLNTIPHWITREDYKNPKPHPEGYLKAIELYGKKGGKVVGFEDTVRGLEALRQTSALPVLICSEHHPLLAVARQGRGLHFPSFRSIQDLH